jgi:hypothetical protein
MTVPFMMSFSLHCLIFILGFVPSFGWTQDLPIFDTHIHYNQPDWVPYPPDAILKIMDQAGIRRALVSSTPDDGTLKLYEKDPKRIISFLRPYRNPNDPASWYRDSTIPAYLEGRLKRQVYKGIGEFHLFGGQANTPVIKWLVDLAAQKNLFLHAHSDDAAIIDLFALRSEAKILWAHAGLSVAVETVGKLLDRYPNLWIELAMRQDIAPGGKLALVWRALILRHPDRIMVGTDTWTTSRWEEITGYLEGVRVWLRQLPRGIAEKIAYQNAERLFTGQ